MSKNRQVRSDLLMKYSLLENIQAQGEVTTAKLMTLSNMYNRSFYKHMAVLLDRELVSVREEPIMHFAKRRIFSLTAKGVSSAKFIQLTLEALYL